MNGLVDNLHFTVEKFLDKVENDKTLINNILNNKMWVNGVQQNMSLAFGTPNPNANFGGGNGAIAFLPGYQATNNNINWNGNCIIII